MSSIAFEPLSEPPPGHQLMAVMTGEPYQPIRLYYQVLKKQAFLGRLKRLHCMQHETESDRWLWLYHREASTLQFQISPGEIPKAMRPLVLGKFAMRSPDLATLDVLSMERGLIALDFFHDKISPKLARPERIRVYNRLSSYADVSPKPGELYDRFDELFENDRVKLPDDERVQAELDRITERYQDPEARRQAIEAFLDIRAKTAMPLVEEYRIYLEDIEERFARIRMGIMTRFKVAMEHWHGNTSYTQHDAILEWIDLVES